VIRIVLDGSFEATASQDLADLQDSLSEHGIGASRSSLTVPGVKIELVTGLAIASLAVASISTLINVINFWKSQRSTAYRISFETAGGEPVPAEDTRAVTDALEKGRVTGIKIEKV
jgi:hypothetical protein